MSLGADHPMPFDLGNLRLVQYPPMPTFVPRKLATAAVPIDMRPNTVHQCQYRIGTGLQGREYVVSRCQLPQHHTGPHTLETEVMEMVDDRVAYMLDCGCYWRVGGEFVFNCHDHKEEPPMPDAAKEVIKGMEAEACSTRISIRGEAEARWCKLLEGHHGPHQLDGPGTIPEAALEVGIQLASALHYSSGKAQHHRVPNSTLDAIALVSEASDPKYAKDNWRLGGSWVDFADSASRHLRDWLAGEDLNDSGMPHLWHALWNLSTLVEWTSNRQGTDDRYKGPQTIKAYREPDADGGPGTLHVEGKIG